MAIRKLSRRNAVLENSNRTPAPRTRGPATVRPAQHLHTVPIDGDVRATHEQPDTVEDLGDTRGGLFQCGRRAGGSNVKHDLPIVSHPHRVLHYGRVNPLT